MNLEPILNKALKGAEYIANILRRIPDRIQAPDRIWLALASYNIGLGHLEDARVLTDRQGANPDMWVDVKLRLLQLRQKKYYKTTRYGYARGHEAVAYVDNIRRYYDTLVWLKEQNPSIEAKTEAAPAADTKLEAEADTKSAPQADTKAEAKPESIAEVKPESKAEAKPEPKAEVKPESKAEAKPEPKAEVKPESKAEAKPEPKAEAKPESTAEAKPEPKSDATPEPTAEAKPEPKTDANPESTAEAKREPKAEVSSLP
ncbi:hypothetical protein RS130_11700 [Paraglaciecola aquimarina]|uniref:Transglycosylase SLT domain-containing protein n=1 Tax=Paraglaciecola aquimarina TaxID=1235557 RepID=A0ABU3SWW1_9ALTE|nr:hypothetical protein [Paraglaciecola aquimarina]MDU0354510.1 hypothetical protein [Paraglaciecola aquimarina]